MFPKELHPAEITTLTNLSACVPGLGVAATHQRGRFQREFAVAISERTAATLTEQFAISSRRRCDTHQLVLRFAVRTLEHIGFGMAQIYPHQERLEATTKCRASGQKVLLLLHPRFSQLRGLR